MISVDPRKKRLIGRFFSFFFPVSKKQVVKMQKVVKKETKGVQARELSVAVLRLKNLPSFIHGHTGLLLMGCVSCLRVSL